MTDTTTTENADSPSTPLTEQAKQKAQQAVQQGQQQAQQVVQQGQQKAGQVVDKVRGQVKTQLTTQKDRLAHEIEGVAQAIRLTTGQLSDQGYTGISSYTEQAAERLAQFSQELGGKDVEELVTDTENFARTRPALFLGGAALL
ncbi:MAG: hypothetical protein M3Y13_10640, partial [Armatimonadota bacterium]|nr:hypothetical protein [Armatimonadota bacterium]